MAGKSGSSPARKTTASPAPPDAIPPSESQIASALGTAFPLFQEMVSRGGTRAAEWRRYNRRSPWVMKVSEGKRALFYARPESRHLVVTVLLGPRAVEAALAGRVSKRLHASIKEAKVYPEGRPVSVVIRKASDVAKVEQLIAVKLATTRSAVPRRPTTESV